MENLRRRDILPHFAPIMTAASTQILVPDNIAWAPAHLHGVLRGDDILRTDLLVTAHSSLTTPIPGDDLRGLPVDEVVLLLNDGERQTSPNGHEFHTRIVASTANLVRDNGIVPTKAWEQDLQRFLDNPVLLYGHSRLPPIGRVVDLKLTRGRNARMEQWWMFNDVTDLSRETHALFAVGDMKAASVGFIVREFHRPQGDELEKLRKKFKEADEWTWIIDRAELVETSAVPIGSDPDALAIGKTRNDDNEDARGRDSLILGAVHRAEDVLETELVVFREEFASLTRACVGGNETACQSLQNVDLSGAQFCYDCGAELTQDDTRRRPTARDDVFEMVCADCMGRSQLTEHAVAALLSIYSTTSDETLEDENERLHQEMGFLLEHHVAIRAAGEGDMRHGLQVMRDDVQRRIDLEDEDAGTIEFENEAEAATVIGGAVARQIRSQLALR